MRITIKDVANLCGLSTATVSRALSEKGKVNVDTYKKIKEAADKLGYVSRSQNEASKTENKKVMVICDMRNQFYIDIIQCIFDTLHKEGYMTALFNMNNSPDLEESFIRFAEKDNYKGIIIIAVLETPSIVKLLSKNACPVVLLGRFMRSMDLNAVCVDNFRGGYMAVNHLIQHGHKNIAFFNGPVESLSSQDRWRGYMAAMNDARLPMEPGSVFMGDYSKESGRSFAHKFMDLGFTAAFSANDMMAIGFIESLKEAGICVPDDISVVSFDDSPAARDGIVKLTTVSAEPNIMGKAAADMILEIIKHNNNIKRKVILPPLLKPRDSVRSISEL